MSLPLLTKTGLGRDWGGCRYALCFLDLGTKYIDMVPVISRTAEVTEGAVDFFIGSSVRGRKRIDVITDGAGEFRRAFADLFIPHTTTTPSRSETNGVAERSAQ
eukprot:3062670-Alexandrium_andersonii.AAC.1